MALFNKKEEVIKTVVNSTVFITSEELEWKVIKIVYDENSISFKEEPIIEYTYIISDSLNATYKIGRTTNNPLERLGNLRTANPRVSLKMVFPFQEFSEKELHEKYDAYRKDREWFFSTKEMTDFVEKTVDRNENLIKMYKIFKSVNGK